MTEILRLAMLALVAFSLFAGVFWGFVRRLKRTLVRFVTLLIALGLAFLLTKLLGAAVGRYIISMLTPMLGDTVGNILAKPEFAAVADAVFEMVAAPFMFLVLYFLLKPLTWILYRIIVSVWKIKGPKRFGRLSGALAGALCGLVCLLVLIVPIFGYLTLANDVVAQFTAGEENAQTADIFTPMLETPVAKQLYHPVGRVMFDALTTVNYNQDKISLQGELSAVISIFKDFQALSGGSSAQYGSGEVQAMKQMASDVGKSKIISCVVSSLLADAADSWLKGEQALGMAKPNLGEDAQGIMDAFLSVFSTATADTIDEDLMTFADSFAILVDSQIFTSGTKDEAFVQTLVSGGIVNKLYAALDLNPRMLPVKTAIRDMGVRVMMQHLGAPEELRENHGPMLEDMATTLKNVTKSDGSIDMAALNAGIGSVMSNYEIPVGAEATQLIADAIAESFTPEEIQTMTPEQIADKLTERFMASGKIAEIPENLNVQEIQPAA